ncbi:MAG TPA: hypothetical protein VGP24_16140 [Glaciihabitans sp.]|jgi:uncharacterized membrane protein|nr:hypothetical protein [Glaciihabitans sp.]
MGHSAFSSVATSPSRTIIRIGLGAILLTAGITHLTVARQEFVAQVPEWVPVDDDLVVLGSGVAEIALGGALIALPRHKSLVGWAAAAFFVAIFPGNISQYVTRTSAFGLDTDRKRFVRLFFQPVLVAVTLWSTGAVRAARR